MSTESFCIVLKLSNMKIHLIEYTISTQPGKVGFVSQLTAMDSVEKPVITLHPYSANFVR